ncbi:HAD-like domain-containing protein [Phlyctochytrium arcticum]|nr:HAD-like domain-containing protein [Phlyctochytrium arcticum]
MYKAVVFDIGGVCVHSPLEGIRSFEAAKGIPQNYLNVAIQSRGEAGAFQQLERGKLSLSEFYPLFGQECSDQANVEHYNAYLRRKGLPDLVNFTPVQVDGKELFLRMMEEATKLDPIVVNAVRKLRESGKFKVAALTNNFQPEDAGDGGLAFGSPPSELVSLFHEYIESSLVGLRKPDPEFFRFACRKIGVEPRFAIMLDDIGPNLKAAADVGMTTIRVVVGKSKEAIRQLEALTGVVLLDPVDTSKYKL